MYELAEEAGYRVVKTDGKLILNFQPEVDLKLFPVGIHSRRLFFEVIFLRKNALDKTCLLADYLHQPILGEYLCVTTIMKNMATII